MVRQQNKNGREDPADIEADAKRRDAQVGDILRDAYADVLLEPIPDSFADLLRKLG